jgi:hypothetical protein
MFGLCFLNQTEVLLRDFWPLFFKYKKEVVLRDFSLRFFLNQKGIVLRNFRSVFFSFKPNAFGPPATRFKAFTNVDSNSRI